MNITQTKEILISIASDRGFDELAKHIESYIVPVNMSNLNITKMPEATCDGCQ